MVLEFWLARVLLGGILYGWMARDSTAYFIGSEISHSTHLEHFSCLRLGVSLIHDLHGRHRRGRNTQDVLRRCGGLIAKAASRGATHSIFTHDCSRARDGGPMTDRHYAVNARFVTQSLTGIQRYCYELTLRLQKRFAARTQSSAGSVPGRSGSHQCDRRVIWGAIPGSNSPSLLRFPVAKRCSRPPGVVRSRTSIRY